MRVGELYLLNRDAWGRIVANEGGVRSGKTYSIAQVLLTELEENTAPTKIEVVRKTLPALKATAMEDFFNIMKDLELYEEEKHHKTDQIYREGRNSIAFFPVDDQQKLRGRKRDILWINEGNELTYEEFQQLAFRTTRRIFIDFNPVPEDHWIFEKVLVRADAQRIHSDYRCNPFLEPEIVSEIEQLQEADEEYWRVFGLGHRPSGGVKIYSHYQLVDELPENPDDTFAGIDFGFNVASAITKVARKENRYTWDQVLYQTHLTNSMLIEEMKRLVREGELTMEMTFYADAAEPDRIQEICDAGFNCKPADKAVKPGIDFVKGRPLSITKRSIKLLDEAKKYSWKTDKDGHPTDDPVKTNDHALDAGRYAEYTDGKELAEGGANIRLL